MKTRWYGQDINFNHINHKYNCLNYWKIEEVLNMLQMILGLFKYNADSGGGNILIDDGTFISSMWVCDILKKYNVQYKPAYFLFGEARRNSVFYYWKDLSRLDYNQVVRLVNYIKDVGFDKTFVYEIAGFETGGGL